MYAMISLVNDRKNREIVKNCNLWSYAFVHVSKLIDKEHNCCISSIPPSILKEHILNINDDIQSIFINEKPNFL
jgi:hypothetical protein